MKVLCINSQTHPLDQYPGPMPVEGETYTVVGEDNGIYRLSNGEYAAAGPCWILEEFPKLFCYEKWRFIPVQDGDVGELVESEELEMVK